MTLETIPILISLPTLRCDINPTHVYHAGLIDGVALPKYLRLRTVTHEPPTYEPEFSGFGEMELQEMALKVGWTTAVQADAEGRPKCVYIICPRCRAVFDALRKAVELTRNQSQ